MNSRYIPSESEIVAAARKLGLAGENGKYPQRDRARIAAAVHATRQDDGEAGPAAPPTDVTTAEVLARFAAELDAAGPFAPGTHAALIAEAGRHLLGAFGLQLAANEQEVSA